MAFSTMVFSAMGFSAMGLSAMGLSALGFSAIKFSAMRFPAMAFSAMSYLAWLFHICGFSYLLGFRKRAEYVDTKLRPVEKIPQHKLGLRSPID